MTKARRILLVEDDKNFGEVLSTFLEMNDYDVTLATDGQKGLLAYNKGLYDLCVLDVMMPKIDGFSLAKEIRSRNKDIPIIFVTAKGMKDDIINGFRIGADDYVTKPFNSDELLCRIEAVMKRAGYKQGELPETFQLGIYTFEHPERKLSIGEQAYRLSPKECALLKMLCEDINKVVSSSQALCKIWGEDNYFKKRSMDVVLTKLRKYIKNDPNLEIINIHGDGYQLKVHTLS